MIWLELPGLPPSDNHAYSTATVKMGKRFVAKKTLSKEGRAYKTEALAHLVQTYPSELTFFEKDYPYLVYVRLNFMTIYNETWPKGAERRYKHLDAGNRRKLLEDVLAEAAGLDDDHNMAIIMHKVEIPSDGAELTQIAVWNLEKEESPFDAGLRWSP